MDTLIKIRPFGLRLCDYGFLTCDLGLCVVYVTGKTSFRKIETIMKLLRRPNGKYVTEETPARPIVLLSLYEWYHYQKYIENEYLDPQYRILRTCGLKIKCRVSAFEPRHSFAHYVQKIQWFDFFRVNKENTAASLLQFATLKMNILDYTLYKYDLELLENSVLWQPDLTVCGDVESNPGPKFNNVHKIHEQIKRLSEKRRRDYIIPKNIQKKFRKQKALEKRTDIELQFNFLELFGIRTNISEQASQLLDDASSALPGVLARYHITLENAQETLDSIRMCTEKINSNKTIMGSLLQMPVSTLNHFSIIIFILICLFLLYKKQYLGCGIVILLLVFFKFPREIISKIHTLIGKSCETVEGIVLQDGFEVSKMIPLIGQIIFTVLAFTGVGCIPHDRFYDSLLKRIDLVPKSLKGALSIWDTAGNLFDTVAKEFKIYILKYNREDVYLEEQLTKEIKNLVDRVEFYNSFANIKEIEKDKSAVDEIGKLYDQLYKWQFRDWKEIGLDNQRIILQIKPTLISLHKKACHSSVHEGGFRKKPIVVMFSGDSQIGKSYLTVPMAIALLKSRGYTDKEKIMNEIYYRCAETEYIVGWTNPKICIFDDFGQIRDLVSKPNPEFFEAIRFANEAPAAIHAAAVEEKNRYFGAEILFLNSNIKQNFSSYITSLVCPSAVINRFSELSFRVNIVPKYQKIQLDSNNRPQILLDKTKCGKDTQGNFRCLDCAQHPTKIHGFCPHIYSFDWYNPLNDRVYKTGLTAHEVYSIILKADKENQASSTDKLEFYSWLVENEFDFQMNMDTADYEWVDDILASEFTEYDNPIFFDASEEILDGCVDLDNPFDAYQMRMLLDFVKSCEFVGMQDIDKILMELAKYPELYSIYTRRMKYGLKGNERQVNDLLITEFRSNYNVRTRNFEQQESWRDILNRKLEYFGKETVSLLKNPVFQIVAIVSTFVGLFAMAYSFTRESKEKIDLGFSGDVVLEHSSAYTPQQKPKIVLEHSSAYTPQQKPKITLEHSSAFVPQQKPKIVLEDYIDQGCLDIETNLIRNNLYNMHTDRSQLGNVIFVKGTTMMFNKHYLDNFSACEDQVIHLSNISGEKLCSVMSHDLVSRAKILYKNNLPTDACIVHLDPVSSKVHPHKNIISKFVSVKDLPKMTDQYAAQMPTYGGQSLSYNAISKRSMVDCKMFDNLIRVEQTKEGVHYDTYFNHYWQYKGSSVGGDCGAPIIINNAYIPHKIVGIHCGALLRDSLGYAQTITQEMLREAVEDRMELGYDLQCNVISEDVPQGKGLIIHGNAPIKVFREKRSKIIPSKLYSYRDTKTKPAYLYEGKHGNPMKKGLEKFCKEVPLIPREYLDITTQALDNIQERNPKRISREKYARVLTFEEAVCGVEGDEFLAPINRGTSMGYPLTQLYPKSNGKRAAYGFDEFTMETPLAKEIEKRCKQLEEECRIGKIDNVYWTDTLKDERRPIEKVDQGKTRVFCAGPVHFTILFRQYFLGYFAWLMHNGNFNDIACGTNVYSNDWNVIGNLLKAKGKTKDNKINVVAGDFSNFDGSLNSQMEHADLQNIKNFYNRYKTNTEDEDRIREVLWMHIVHATHICDDTVFTVTHGQPSGGPGTAINNSKVNMRAIRITYLMVLEDAIQYMKGLPCKYTWNFEFDDNFLEYIISNCNMVGYEKYIKLIAYGDDNLIAINENLVEIFNQETITFFLAILGFTYTDESKSGKTFKIRDLSEVKFLKRSFVFDSKVNRYIAPLDLDVILEICQWTKKGLQQETITISNIDVTMRELSLHSEDVFREWSKKIQDAVYQSNLEYNFLTQIEYRNLVLKNGLGQKLLH